METNFEKAKLQEMERSISDFLVKKGLSSFDTKDPVALARKLGFSLYLANFDETIDGVIIVDETTDKVGRFDSNKVIAVNSSANKIEKRFIIAHEIAHYIAAPENGGRVIALREHFTSIKSFDEQQIDYMAAALLMPKAEFKADLDILRDKKAYPNLTEEQKIEKLIEKYFVDREAVKRRISEIEKIGE